MVAPVLAPMIVAVVAMVVATLVVATVMLVVIVIPGFILLYTLDQKSLLPDEGVD